MQRSSRPKECWVNLASKRVIPVLYRLGVRNYMISIMSKLAGVRGITLQVLVGSPGTRQENKTRLETKRLLVRSY